MMKQVYRCRSGQAAHQWIEQNKKEHEEHLRETGCYTTI